MIDGINAATPAPNVLPNVDNRNNDVQKKQEETPDVQAEETSDVNSTENAEYNEETSDVQAEETDHMESAQSGYGADAEPTAAQNESNGTVLDISG